MQKNIFISFLGTGNYDSVQYENSDITTPYVQIAIVNRLGKSFFDHINIIVTKESREKHWNALCEGLKEYNDKDSIDSYEISQDLVNDQWSWFEQILNLVDDGDNVWFDMTHGYRAFSIVLSAALNFIQRTKNINLQAVYYGAHDAPNRPIIDMVDFYRINDWADGVSQLIDTADVSKLARLAENATSKSFESLNNKELIKSLEELTRIIRNVDVNRIIDESNNALSIISSQIAMSNGADKPLLELVLDKFKTLATDRSSTGRYDKDYFNSQLALISMLNKHELYMQSFTVISETLGSIGMLGAPNENKSYKEKDIDQHRNYAETFQAMMNISEKKWNFNDKGQTRVDYLAPFVKNHADEFLTPIPDGDLEYEEFEYFLA